MRNKLLVLSGTIIMLLILLLCIRAASPDYIPIYGVLDSGKTEEKILAYKQGKDLFFFLPSYANMDNLKLYPEAEVYINGNKIRKGEACGEYQTGNKYDLKVGNNKYNVSFIKSSNVASLYIDTRSGTMDRIYDNKDYKERIHMRLVDKNGAVSYEGENDELSGRGNSTWSKQNLEKKPFSLDLNLPHNLLGMGEGQKWALLANAKDRTNIKNKMVCDFAAEIGFCSPKSEYVDLYLNGEYNGLYLLSETVDCINKTDFDENTDVLFLRDGGYKKYNYHFMTSDQQPVGIKRPDIMPDNRADEFKNLIQSMENSFLSKDGYDEVSGKYWTDFIDIDSWVKKYLIEEVFMNIDGGFNSQFFNWKPNGDNKIHAGPAWDYDVVLDTLTARCFVLGEEKRVNDNEHTSWYISLYNKKEFKEALLKEYENTFLPGLEKLQSIDIDKILSEIESASYMNGLRWQKMYSIPSDEEAVNKIKSRLKDHIEFLNSAWIDGVEYCNVIFKRENTLFMYSPFAAEKGKPFYDMPDNSTLSVSKDTVWYNDKTGEVFDRNTPVNEDILLRTKSNKSTLISRLKANKEPVFCIFFGCGLILFLIIALAADKKRH